jgi:hypothetical protein
MHPPTNREVSRHGPSFFQTRHRPQNDHPPRPTSASQPLNTYTNLFPKKKKKKEKKKNSLDTPLRIPSLPALYPTHHSLPLTMSFAISVTSNGDERRSVGPPSRPVMRA